MSITTNKVASGRSGVTRITLLEADGSETVINVNDTIHFLLAFAKVDMEQPENNFPGEVLVQGNVEVVGEMYYQIGNENPDLIKHCVRRSTEAVARKIFAEIKKSGVDPIAEALKKMPTPEAKGGWN